MTDTSFIDIAGVVVSRILNMGEPVITFAMVDEVHQRPTGTAGRTFRENRERFVEGHDFIEVCADVLRRHNGQGLDVKRRDLDGAFSKFAASGILITRRGYLKLVKPMRDDRAWQVQDEMIDRYFIAEELLAGPEPKSDQDAAGSYLSPLAGLDAGSLGEIQSFVGEVRRTFDRAEARRIYNLLVPPMLRAGRTATLPAGADPRDGHECLTYLLGLDVGGRAVSGWIADGQDAPALNRVGLRVREDGLFLSHQTPVFADSRWSGMRHRAALLTLDGVFTPPNALRLHHHSQRGLVVPLSAIAGGLHDVR